MVVPGAAPVGFEPVPAVPPPPPPPPGAHLLFAAQVSPFRQQPPLEQQYVPDRHPAPSGQQVEVD
jgi:hypothetical protein